jgi:hypothetical protein
MRRFSIISTANSISRSTLSRWRKSPIFAVPFPQTFRCVDG